AQVGAAPRETVHDVSERAVRAALAGSPAWGGVLRDAAARGVPGVEDLDRSVVTGAASFGPMHFESSCGFKLRGAQVADVHSHGLDLERLGSSDMLVRLNA